MKRLLAIIYIAFLIVAFSTCDATVFERSAERANNRSANIAMSIGSAAIERNVQRTAKKLINDLRTGGGCNKTICFALEASRAVSDATYKRQGLLTKILSSIISADNGATFAAVQYASTTFSVKNSTSRWYEFVTAVEQTPKNGGADINLSGALVYCGFQARRAKPKEGSIIVIGSGRFTVGFEPTFVAAVVEEEAKIIPVSTTGRVSEFRESLGLDSARRDVISFTSENNLPEALQSLVPRICS